MLKKFIHLIEPYKKLYSHNEYKKYRNMLSTLLKRSKQSYFYFYFFNWNNIKNTWNRIKSLITFKDISTSIPRTWNHKSKTVTNPVGIGNIFNNHCASEARKTRANVNYSHFPEYMENNSSKSFFLSPTNKNEIWSIISSLNLIKSVGPSSMPTKTLKLLKDEILSHLSDICNICFSMGVFPSVLKTAKVIPVHKKESKLDYNNYHPYIFYQILKN